jgi:hypothetical protein
MKQPSQFIIGRGPSHMDSHIDHKTSPAYIALQNGAWATGNNILRRESDNNKDSDYEIAPRTTRSFLRDQCDHRTIWLKGLSGRKST